MKIAVISEDGTTISQHFGRAPYYVVVTAEDGEVVDKEKRDKPGHHSFAHQHQEHDTHDERHGLGAKAQSKHARRQASQFAAATALTRLTSVER